MKAKRTYSVLVALPFAYRDGVSEYNGIMRYIQEKNLSWNLCIMRNSFSSVLSENFSVRDFSGIICGMDFRPNAIGYTPCYPFEIQEMAEKCDVPFVGLDVPDAERRKRSVRRQVLLNVDSHKVGVRAAQVLTANDYVSYGFVSAFSELDWSRQRAHGFTMELNRIGAGSPMIYGKNAMLDDADLVAWLRGLPKPCGVFASNDCCANYVLRLCAANGLKVPDDLAVLGVDDDPIFCVHTKPTLSSLFPDFEEEGYAAAKCMAMLLAGRKVSVARIVGGNVTCTHRTSTAPCSPAGRLVRKAEEIIAARALTGISSDILASELRISRRLLDQRFRQINGRSVHEAVENIKLEHVKRLLSGSRLTHLEIARQCGFSSASYLETVFVKRFGMTMSEFRSC